MNLLSKDNWNEFVAQNSSPSSFLQSWQWGEFQEALGNKVYRLSFPFLSPGGRGEGEGGSYLLLAQVVIKKLLFGRTYLEIPKGPIFGESRIMNYESGGMQALIEKIKEIGKQEKAVLLRISPPYPPHLSSPTSGEEMKEGELESLGFRKPELLLRQMEPARTILVDLNKSEDEFLLNMHEKARYNIRLAQRRGVKVRVATQDRQAFEKFLVLLEETTKRDKIVSWPRERFMKFRDIFMTPSPDDLSAMSSSFDPEGSQTLNGRPNGGRVARRGGEGLNVPHAELLVGEYQGEILAAAIIMLFGDAGTYLYAASSAKDRTTNVPSLVLWEAIKLCKACGKKWYDMWGVAPVSEPNHAWAGITRFKSRYVKLGVTGREFFGTGTDDLVLDRFYYGLFKLGKKLGF